MLPPMAPYYVPTGTAAANVFTNAQFVWDRFRQDNDTVRSTQSVDLSWDVTGVIAAKRLDELARLSSWVYRDNDAAFADLWVANGGDYQLIKTSDQLPHANSPDYYGAVVKNVKDNTFIVVHRGTDNWDSDLNGIDGPPQDPVTGTYYTEWPSRQILDAQQMTNLAYQAANNSPGALVYQTGHSLGGRLASIASKNGHADAVFTFNTAWQQSNLNRPNVYNFRIANDWVTNIAIEQNLLEGKTYEIPPLSPAYDTWNRHGMIQFTGQLGFSANYIENVTLTNVSTALNATGNDLNNVLTGNQFHNVLRGQFGSDTLKGAAGNDTLEGGLGADLLRGDTGNDTYLYKKGDGLDTVVDAGNITDSAHDWLKLTDISKTSVKFAYDGMNLKVSYAGATNTNVITLKNQNSLNYRVEHIQAADGSQVNVSSIIGLINSYATSQGVSVASLNLDNTGLQSYLLSHLNWA